MQQWIRAHWPSLLLVIIVVTAAALRFYDLGRGDLITDEASINWRAIGPFDFLGTPFQTTPLEWVQQWYWWFTISFHDLPPLFFWLQHVMFTIFGVSVIVMRIVPALAGVASVIMIYVIGKKIASVSVAYWASALLAINVYGVWISRIALQESLVIFITLFAFYAALRAFERPRWWYLFGLIAGIAIMVKPHAIIIWPIVGTVALLYNRSVWQQKTWYWSWLICLIILGPYLLYNYEMYRAFGHFDFQWSYFFHQSVPAWSIRPGREEFTSITQSIRYFFLNLRDGLSPVMNIALLLSFGYWALIWKKLDIQQRRTLGMLFLIICWYWLLFLAIGPSRRFLSLMIPWLCLWLALMATRIVQKRTTILIVVVVCFFSYELYYSINTSLIRGWGNEGWFYSRLRYQVEPHGYRALESFVDSLVRNRKPAVLLPIANANISNFTNQRVHTMSGQSAPIMFVYDPRLYGEEVFWIFTRRLIYEGWPALSYGIYHQVLTQQGSSFFYKLGVRDIYYFDGEYASLQSPVVGESVHDVEVFRQQLPGVAEKIKDIYDDRGKIVFTIYHIALHP